MLYLTSDVLTAHLESTKATDFGRLAFLSELLEEGTQIFVPEDHELTLDYDAVQIESLDALESHIWGICETFDLPVVDIDIRPSNTQGHYHGIVTLEECVEDLWKRATLQLLMGSDPVREKMALARALRNVDFPCVLFKHSKPKDQIDALQTFEY